MEAKYLKIDRDDPNISYQARQYKTLRLKALELSPTAFSSTLQIESAFSEETWIGRITDPLKETFICAVTSDQGVGEWAAQVTLRGPVTADDYQLPAESGQSAPLPDELQEKWQMLSLYTLPGYRGKGLGKKLCQTAFEFLARKSGIAPSIQVRIMVKAENQVTLGLYGSMGFVRTGTCTLEEALNANGDSDLIPPAPLPDLFTRRGGVIMALDIPRKF
ncbi:putative N-acetyltransferase domain-containing protein [Seiridium unicorne]|uniref:N-acetyltransferase domain-containing protein n=1 Tax=Seiridium unicorne TaxID=138068 RepID=A0ABR2VI70_9PEZI